MEDKAKDSQRPGDWQCQGQGCQFLNFARRTKCLHCKAPKPEGENIERKFFSNLLQAYYFLVKDKRGTLELDAKLEKCHNVTEKK